jgi:hypothetical protein
VAEVISSILVELQLALEAHRGAGGRCFVDMDENWKSPATTEILTPEEKVEKSAIMKATEKVSRNASVGDLRLI